VKQRFDLGKKVATGGMAEVFLGHTLGEAGFKKPVVIKRLLPHLTENEMAVGHFLNEAALASHLHHQNVVEVMDVGELDGACFLVMELVDGWDLHQVLSVCSTSKIALPPFLAAYIAEQVLNGLCHAYKPAPGKPPLLAHRDVSPSNILISREGEVKVTDFGIAKIESGAGTQLGVFKGKPAYAAPEAFRGEAVTALADQFGLGLVLFEMLEGKRAFGPTEPLQPYLQRLMEGKGEPMTSAAPALQQIVRRMLRIDQHARFPADGGELHDALASFIASTGQHAGPRELTKFLSALPLPKTLAERAASMPAAPGATTLGGSSMPSAVDTGGWLNNRTSLDASGKVVHRTAPAAAAEAPGPIELEAGPEQPEALELAFDPVQRRATSPYEAPAGSYRENVAIWKERRDVAVKWFLGIAVLGALATAAFIFIPNLQHLLPLPQGANPGPGALTINSEPSGASVRINGTVMGQTPFGANNVWKGHVQLELFLAGYESYFDSFEGGQQARISATLKKKR
jgi:serine/threonine protein kinase